MLIPVTFTFYLYNAAVRVVIFIQRMSDGESGNTANRYNIGKIYK